MKKSFLHIFQCEERISSHFPMWRKDFLTFSNVRKSFPHIGKCEERISSHFECVELAKMNFLTFFHTLVSSIGKWGFWLTFWQMDHPLTNGPHLLTNGPPFWQMDHPLTNGPPFDKWLTYFFTFLRENFSREKKFRSRMFERCRVFFFPWIADVWEVWDIFFEITNVWEVWRVNFYV